jgi:hypothetical protein
MYTSATRRSLASSLTFAAVPSTTRSKGSLALAAGRCRSCSLLSHAAQGEGSCRKHDAMSFSPRRLPVGEDGQLTRTPSRRSLQNTPQANFRLCEVALLGHRPWSARHGSVVQATGCFWTHVSARTPPQSISAPARKTSVFAPSSRTPRKKVLYVRVLFGSPEM